MKPIPGGFAAAERVPNAAQVRVSQTGLAAVTADPAALIEGVTGGPLQFDVPANCSGSPSTCCPGGNPITPCGPIVIDLVQRPGDQPRLVVAPSQGNARLDVTLRARVHTMMDVPVNVPLVGDCGLHIDTEDAGADDLIVNLPVSFVQDAMLGTTRIQPGTAAISQLDNGDVALTGGFGCQFASLGIGFFIGTLTDTFAGAISDAINDQLCKPCPSGDSAECGAAGVTCMDNVCMKDASTCMQEVGVTGRMSGSGTLPGGAGALDLYEVLGGYGTTNNNGIALGMLGGMLPAGAPRDRCGPPATAPARATIPQSTFFQGNTRPDNNQPFDIGIGVHQSQLDQFAYAGYEGGFLCLTVGNSTVDLLTTDTFALFLQSLPNLAGGSRPLAVGLRPQKPPTITLGTNTFMDDGMGGRVVDEPLLDLMFDDLEIDFFAQIEDQYIRIFTLVADVHLPIGLEVGGNGELTPVLGQVDNAFTNLSVKNSEPLVETPDQLAAIFPMILDLALPQLIGGLGAFQVPELAGLQIDVTAITAVDNKAFLAIYGELSPASMAKPERVETTAVILAQRIPGTDTFDDPTRWSKERRPQFELALGGSAEPGDLEWSVKVDQGTWSAFSSAPRRTLSSNLFWMQGKHQVEVRARKRGQPQTTDLTPIVLDPTIDTIAPVPELLTDGTLIRIGGTDTVSGDKLTGRWRLKKGAWHEVDLPAEVAIGDARPIDLEIEVYDEAGNMAPTRGQQAVFRADFHGQPGESGCNCGASGDPRGAAVLFVFVALVLMRRRNRRAWAARLSVLVIGAVLPACSCGSDKPCGDIECLPGEVAQGPIGRWNAIAGDGSRTVITTYDSTLGDVVLADVSSSGELSYRVLDGVPDETPTYDPSGYRGGIESTGPDVGAWTSVGLAGGLVRAAYQDRERHALRIAVETQRDRFTTSDVDVPEGDEVIGLHTSLVIGSAPAIAYVVTGVVAADGSRHTELRLARATSAQPSGPGDWNISALATAPSSCGGMCGSQHCVAPAMDGAPETCAAESGTCTAACGDTQVCVGGACRDEVPDPKVEDLPGGTGLFPTLLLMPDGRLTVVFYDRVRTALVALSESGPGTGSFAETVLDGADDADKGMWASAAVDASGTIHVAYQEALGDQLMYTTFGSSAGTPVVVDDGVREGDRTHSVGAGATLWIQDGSPRIAYQDGTISNLVVATQSGTTWSHADLATGDLLDGFHIAAIAGRLVWDQLDKTHSPPHVLQTQTAP
jgi:MYXO-CTERM domain-containing protein